MSQNVPMRTLIRTLLCDPHSRRPACILVHPSVSLVRKKCTSKSVALTSWMLLMSHNLGFTMGINRCRTRSCVTLNATLASPSPLPLFSVFRTLPLFALFLFMFLSSSLLPHILFPRFPFTGHRLSQNKTTVKSRLPSSFFCHLGN